eukprot:scaffold4875_cov155-Amphora_coffeaeformis.AAC.2
MDPPPQPTQPQEPPPGFYLTHHAISEKAWDEIRTWLGLEWDDPDLGFVFENSDSNKPTIQHKANSNDIPWEISTPQQNRPVAQFGFRYDYCHDTVVSATSSTPAIPPLLRQLLLDPLVEETNDKDAGIQHLFQQHIPTFTQCIINAYGANDTSHIPFHTDDDQFGPVIIVYTAGETRPLELRCSPHHTYTAYPRHLSRYILSGQVREQWEHAVPAGKGWRISITFRSWRERKP